MKDEIILYRPNELAEHIEVRMDEETVWLTQKQIAELFGTEVPAINKHIKNIYKEGELQKVPTVSILEIVQQEGNRSVTRKIEHYNLDVIISVGYRVNSSRATQFRIWANRVLKDYLLKGYATNNRMNRIEDTVEKLSKKVNEIDFQIKSSELPRQGVFFDGQIFDAYELASKIIRSAKEIIVLIDNYIDESALTHLAKKKNGVVVLLLTKTIPKQLQLDLKKANEQYGHFEAKVFTQSHDRFLIIDQKEIYHLGASLKDLGKKWFAFSKLEAKSVENMMKVIKELL